MTALLATATSMSASYNGRVFVDITDTEKFNTTRHEDWINNLHDYAANEQVELDDQYADKEPAIRIQTHFKDGRMSETDCLILRAGCCQPARQVGSPCISINKDLTYTNLAILYFRLLADIYTTYLQTFSTIHFFCILAAQYI